MIKTDCNITDDRKSLLMWEPDLWLPQESFWSVWNRFHDLNATCFQNLFSQDGIFPEHMGSSRQYDPELAISGLTKSQKEVMLSILGRRPEHQPFRDIVCYHKKERKTSISENLKYCPKCMQYGYHSTLHQHRFADRCFIHGEQLQTATRKDGYKIRYRINKDMFHNYAYQYDRMDLRKELGIMDFWSFLKNASRIKEQIQCFVSKTRHLQAYQNIDIYVPGEDAFTDKDITARIMGFLLDGSYQKIVLGYERFSEKKLVAQWYRSNQETFIAGHTNGDQVPDPSVYLHAKEVASNVFSLMKKNIAVSCETFGQSGGLNVGEALLYSQILNDVIDTFIWQKRIQAQGSRQTQHAERENLQDPVYLFTVMYNGDIRILRI